MGLDGVELIMAIEDEFNIVVTEQEAYNTLTPSDLTDLVYKKLRTADSVTCNSQKEFYNVREKIIAITGLHKRKIKPNTKLSTLFRRSKQKRNLVVLTESLAGEDGVHLVFKKPMWLKLLTFILGLAVFLYIFFQSHYDVGSSIFFSLMFLLIFHIVTSPFKDELPSNYQTVKDLIKINSSTDSRPWNREEVYSKVKNIIIEQLNVEPEMVLPDSHFIDDLGMG